MPYDPDKHHRRSIRLRGYDYTQEGVYFLTICSYQRKCVFGDVIDDHMMLNKLGSIAEECWRNIPDHFPQVELDEFVVMPNHVHGIIVIVGDSTNARTVGARHALPDLPTQTTPPRAASFGKPVPGSVGIIVGSFKSAASRRINLLRDTPGAPVWQRNYHEHIIRSEKTYNFIRQYVLDNPSLWEEDRLYNPD